MLEEQHAEFKDAYQDLETRIDEVAEDLVETHVDEASLEYCQVTLERECDAESVRVCEDGCENLVKVLAVYEGNQVDQVDCRDTAELENSWSSLLKLSKWRAPFRINSDHRCPDDFSKDGNVSFVTDEFDIDFFWKLFNRFRLLPIWS